MTDKEKIRKCIELVWDYEENYDGDDLLNFQNKELSTYTQHESVVTTFNKYIRLEKENAELKEKVKHRNCVDCSNHGKQFEVMKLEKENKLQEEEIKKLNQTEWEDADTIAHMASTIAELEEENAKLKVVCDYNCPDHKLATHNACLLCPAIRNSPYHDLKNVSDEELQMIIKNAEIEMEM